MTPRTSKHAEHAEHAERTEHADTLSNQPFRTTRSVEPPDALRELAARGQRRRNAQHGAQGARRRARKKDALRVENIWQSHPLLKLGTTLFILLTAVFCFSAVMIPLQLQAPSTIPFALLLYGLGAWWGVRRFRAFMLRRLERWAESLPFPVVGFHEWLAIQDIFPKGEETCLSFDADVPKEVVEGAIATVVSEGPFRWEGDRRVQFLLPHARFHTRASVSYADLRKLRKLANDVLIPIHASYPIHSIELTAQR